jgi:hypothetical protein
VAPLNNPRRKVEMLFNEKELKNLVAGKSKAEILGEGGILKSLVK